DKRVDQIAQARLDIAGLLDALGEGRLPSDDRRAIAHEFCRVEHGTQAGLLRLHNLPRGRWGGLDGQLRKSWHGVSPLRCVHCKMLRHLKLAAAPPPLAPARARQATCD